MTVTKNLECVLMIRVIIHDHSLSKKSSVGNKSSSISYLSTAFLRKNGIKTGKVILEIGAWSKEFIIKINNAIPKDSILVSKRDIPFDLPEELSYEMKIEGNSIRLGPVICFVPKKRATDLTIKAFRNYENRLNNYLQIGGLIFIVAGDSVDPNKSTLSGYYFNPNGTKISERWVKGEFPYPDAIVNKSVLPHHIEAHLQKITNNRLFNTGKINKLTLWNACSTNRKLQNFVPVTIEFQSTEDLRQMIYQFNIVYLKPTVGKQGNGITMVKKELHGFQVITDDKKKKNVNSFVELKQFLDQVLLKRTYIIQQGIPTTYNSKHVDFRFYFQKNDQKNWVCQGSLGRVAHEESIVTNLKHLAHLADGEKTIKIVFKVSNDEAKTILASAINVCKGICEELDKKGGHFGDIALDVIIDKNHKPWILEINNLYGTKSLEILDDKETLLKLRTTPFEYAKALAGF
jgi:hypothetical protein